MHAFIALYFFVIAMILSGLLYISMTSGDVTSHRQSRRYWSLALSFDVLGLIFFSLIFDSTEALTMPRSVGTLANTGLFGAFVFQALSFRALRQNVSKTGHRIAWITVVVFGLAWQLGKGWTTAEVKGALFGVVSSVLLIWQMVETYRNQQTLARSQQLRMVMITIMAELVWTVLRVWVFVNMTYPMVQVEQIPFLAIATTWLQLASKVLGYAAVTGYWVEVVTDTKTRIDMENQQFRVLSRQQEKLIADLGRLNKAATTGVLAASIAHELNQPLQSALLNHEMLASELAITPADTASVQELMQEQGSSLQRMSAIIQTMRGVFSESGDKPQALDLYRLVEGLGPLIHAQAQKQGIQVQTEQLGEGLAHVKPSEVQQVLLNLLGNAFDALSISQTPQPTIRVKVTTEGAWVVCAVEDNGPGIEEELHEEVFKLLRTTKHAGMGLGLWLARYITERNHGHIQVGRSELGGALLSVRFPKLPVKPLPV